jgi:hypothetical protein
VSDFDWIVILVVIPLCSLLAVAWVVGWLLDGAAQAGPSLLEHITKDRDKK